MPSAIIQNLADLKRLVAIELLISDRYHQNLLKHCSRVSLLCRSFGEQVQLSGDSLDKLEVAGLLHDYSLKSLGFEWLNSKLELTTEQWTRMQQHSLDSAELALHITGDRDIADWIQHHHCTGNPLLPGYPVEYCATLQKMAPELQILICADSSDSGLSGRWKDAKDSQAVAVEIENLGRKRVVSFEVAHNFARYLKRGLHLPFYQEG